MKKVLFGLLFLSCLIGFSSLVAPVYSQSLPDLVPNSFSACYRPKASDPERVEVVLSAWEKNIGTETAAAHTSALFAGTTYDCQEAFTKAKEVDVPVLAPNQVVPLYRDLVLGDFPKDCANLGYLDGTVIVDLWSVVAEDPQLWGPGELNNDANIIPVPPCGGASSISCTASFNPTSGTVKQGQTFDLKGKINSISGGNGSGYHFMWARKYSYGNYLYPPTINPTQVGVWYPGRWSSAGQPKGQHKLVFIAKNKDKSWNYAVECNGRVTVKVVK